MKKPNTLPPPMPKPRPPPKPEIPLKSVAKICPATGKPIVPPKPHRRTPPSIATTNNNVAHSKIKANLADEVSERPFTTSCLLRQTTNVVNDIESEKTTSDLDILDKQDLYDDVNVHSKSDSCIEPQLPISRKPLSSSSLIVRPTPSPRLSPHASPTISPISGDDYRDTVQPTPRPRAKVIETKDEENSAKVLQKKPEIPPKPVHLLKIYNSSNFMEVGEKNTGGKYQEQSVVVQHIPACSKQGNQSKSTLPTSPPKTNSLNISEECNNSIYKLTAGIGVSNNTNEAIKKRIASRRQLNPQNANRTFPVDVKNRRPPPPPPSSSNGSPKKKEPTVSRDLDRRDGKGPTVSRDLDRGHGKGSETTLKTAEDQSLYCYAYEHPFLTVTMHSNCPNPQGNQSEDNSYIEPDATAVKSFMEQVKEKECVSSGQYEIPAEGGQEDILDQVEHESKSVTSTKYTIPEQIVSDDQDDNIEVESSDSEDYHEYEYPKDTPPPLPPHRMIHSGWYDLTPFTDEVIKDDDDDDGKDTPSPLPPHRIIHSGWYDVTPFTDEVIKDDDDEDDDDGKDTPPPLPPHRIIHRGSYDVTPFTDEVIKDDDDEDDDDGKDTPPPLPPHRIIHRGSYDVTPFTDEVIKDDDDEDDDDDYDGEYVEPPDTQGSSEEDSDEEIFWGDDDESVEEPLYQIYAARTLQKDRTLSRKRTKSNQQTETFIDDLTKGTLRNMRMLWCEIPEVVSSGILDNIDPEERKRQEAMFEVITSEASYLKSINILESYFMKSPELTPGTPQGVIEKAQHHILFSNVRGVVETSEMFLEALRKRQKESLVISSISDIVEEFATKYFEVYVKYCSNQLYQERVIKELRKNSRYVEAIQRLEKCSTAQCLSMHSFLVLPMQRITRLPLLVDAICHRCQPGSDEFIKTDAALKAVSKVVQNCNEGARKMERMEELVNLQPQIEFTIKPIALVTTNRWLLRRGEVVLVIEQPKNPLSKKKLKLKPVYMFLFNDLLLITKKKGERRYRVLDYAARHMTKVEESTDPAIQLDYMLSLILLENSNAKTKDFIVCAESQTDKTRWLEAFNPPKGEQEGEKVYGAWDCPQVQVVHDYSPQQPDELALHEGDVINVQRKLPDGWYYGERLCDGVCGWFPANYTENIRNEHVRARNLLQRYRLLAASKHLFGAVQTMKAPKMSKLSKGMMKRDTIA